METKSIKVNEEQFIKPVNDVELIKTLLLPKYDDEGELSDWAKSELERSRKTSEREYVSLEDIKKKRLSMKQK